MEDEEGEGEEEEEEEEGEVGDGIFGYWVGAKGEVMLSGHVNCSKSRGRRGSAAEVPFCFWEVPLFPSPLIVPDRIYTLGWDIEQEFNYFSNMNGFYYRGAICFALDSSETN